MEQVHALANKFATADLPVMITGETGVGKLILPNASTNQALVPPIPSALLIAQPSLIT